MTAYYNEIDPQAAQWLRNLIAAGHIAPGDVDNRSILEVRPHELVGYAQCHFFAGVGVWSHALRRAGWPDDRPAWTGSCPCQPFSEAGSKAEFDDARHLWPAWFRLIRECRPGAVFGEQVAAKVGLAWLDHVSTDLEGEGYTFGAVDTCAAGFGAPHRRQRFFFVAHADGERQPRRSQPDIGKIRSEQPAPRRGDVVRCSVAGALDYPTDPRHDDQGEHGGGSPLRSARSVEPGPIGGWWDGAEWIGCSDGKRRPIEPGSFPLAHGAPARVVRLRAYGNAIVAPVAEEFIRAYMSL